MTVTAELITAVGVSLVAPILGYFKIQDSRRDTATHRDIKHRLLEQRVSTAEQKLSEIDDIKEMVSEIRIVVSRMETFLIFFQKHLDREDSK